MMFLDLVTLVVDDYDRALQFFVGTLGFALDEDADLGKGKRWVVVRPHPTSAGLLLAKAVTDEQATAIGNQTGGRVSFFLRTDDLDQRVRDWTSQGVDFVERPRHEEYGRVVVFVDPFGNRWDLIEPSTGGEPV